MEHNTDTDSHKLIFQGWVMEYSDEMYSWAFHKTSNAQLAEDLVQDTFLAAFNSYSSFRKDSNPKTWLIAILNNKIIDHYRKQDRNPLTSEASLTLSYEDALESRFDKDGRWLKKFEPKDWPEDNHLLDDAAFNRVLDHCMSELPDQWNKAISLKYLKGQKGKTISQELGITSSNYWQILHRAKVFLRECLDELWVKK